MYWGWLLRETQSHSAIDNYRLAMVCAIKCGFFLLGLATDTSKFTCLSVYHHDPFSNLPFAVSPGFSASRMQLKMN
jgi:hypothetical protein